MSFSHLFVVGRNRGSGQVVGQTHPEVSEEKHLRRLAETEAKHFETSVQMLSLPALYKDQLEQKMK